MLLYLTTDIMTVRERVDMFLIGLLRADAHRDNIKRRHFVIRPNSSRMTSDESSINIPVDGLFQENARQIELFVAVNEMMDQVDSRSNLNQLGEPRLQITETTPANRVTNAFIEIAAHRGRLITGYNNEARSPRQTKKYLATLGKSVFDAAYLNNDLRASDFISLHNIVHARITDMFYQWSKGAVESTMDSERGVNQFEKAKSIIIEQVRDMTNRPFTDAMLGEMFVVCLDEPDIMDIEPNWDEYIINFSA